MQLKDLIQGARKRAKLTQAELAERMEVHPKTVGAWERGKAHPRGKLPRLEKVLGVKLVSRPEDVQPTRDRPATQLSTPELIARIHGDVAVLAQRATAEGLEPFDAETALGEGWNVTRLSDIRTDGEDQAGGTPVF